MDNYPQFKKKYVTSFSSYLPSCFVLCVLPILFDDECFPFLCLYTERTPSVTNKQKFHPF